MLPRHDVVEPVFGARQARVDCYAVNRAYWSRRIRRRAEPWLMRKGPRRRAEHPVTGGPSRRLDANARSSWREDRLFWLWVTAVALAVLNTIAKEFVDKQSMSKRARLGWSALIVVVASVGGILTVRRAVLSGQAIAAIDAKYASRTFTDDQRRALRDALAQHRVKT